MNAITEVLDRLVREVPMGAGHIQAITEARTAINELIEAGELAQRMNREALPKFNWAKSPLDANAIDLLNRAPGTLAVALARAKGEL